MTIDEQLQEATRNAIKATKSLNRSQWPTWADNIPIFTLCRYLGTVVDGETDADDLEPYVMAFWSATHQPPEWEAALGQFQDLWDHSKARMPAGADIVRIAVDRARRTKDHPEWANLSGPRLRCLARICWELASMHANGRFFLSQQQAAKLLDIDRKTAGRMFHQLCREGILIEADRPPKGTIKAIRYRFCRIT